MKLPILLIVGPTASGKSQVAMALAKKLNGEIISADSMQVYRGMNIGTDKPSKFDRLRVKHHLIDILKPSQNFSVFEFQKLAIKKISEIQKKGKFPVVVGGTGLYIRALVQGLDERPSENIELRDKWQSEAETHGALFVHQHLKKISPEKAEEIHPNNLKRVIRAIEIIESPKIKAVGAAKKLEGLTGLGLDFLLIGIRRSREELYARINQRVDLMFKKGLVREVQKLGKKKISQTALQGLGYKEVLAAVDGQTGLDEARDLIKKNTRHFAKRQLTWFKREQEILWFDWGAADSLVDVTRRICLALKLKRG